MVAVHDSHVEPIQAAHRSDCASTGELVRALIEDEELTFTPSLHGLPDNLKDELDLPTKGTEAPSPG